MFSKKITISTQGRGSIAITREIQLLVRESKVSSGLCHKVSAIRTRPKWH